jgi:hypothetical protein
MTIAKALKEKNRIAGRIKKLQRDIQMYNRTRDDRASDFDANQLHQELQKEIATLIDLKTKIAKANIGIVDKLVQLAETKSQIAYWTAFRTGSASEPISESKYINGDYASVDINAGHVICSKTVHDMLANLQATVESLQDDIDEFNATASVA